MRKIAQITKWGEEDGEEPYMDLDDWQVRRAMLYAIDGGACLFLYTRLADGPCDSDNWYWTIEEAERDATERFGITAQDWKTIDDPLPGARHDWIRPTRVKRDPDGYVIRGAFEPIPAEG